MVGFHTRIYPEDMSGDDRDWIQANAHVSEEDESWVVSVGSGHFVVCDLQFPAREVLEALDAREGDLETVGARVLNLDGHGLVADLPVESNVFAGGMVIVNNVHIDPCWTGAKLGLIGTALVLRHFSFGCGVAALYPMKPGARDDERASSAAGLGRYWGRLGFVEHSGNVFVAALGWDHLDSLIGELNL